VVAEGIDDEEQVRILRLLGCKRGQGYLFGQAVPADEFAARIAAEADGPAAASAIA
jgi:EAL domain-containing protein (putative c-di-GMP-specific phosphodiesterase class I)